MALCFYTPNIVYSFYNKRLTKLKSYFLFLTNKKTAISNWNYLSYFLYFLYIL